ncbi:MAG: hypothetical protein KF905_14140 [Flavobacteriales bacterium]|nr:hypothetical protein [Flavobacteriales bacterium]
MGDEGQFSREDIKRAMGNVTDEDLVPRYRTIYTPDTVELEEIGILLNKMNIDQSECIIILANSCPDIKANYNNYLLDSYKTLSLKNDRLVYLDIGNFAQFIVWKFKSNETACFDRFFESAEVLLSNGDRSTQELIVVGLFEGIQNVGGWHNVDYYKGFDRWLRPQSKKAWDDLIEDWEGIKND